jgi:aconitate hydratase
MELEYYRHGGILQYVLRHLLAGQEAPVPAPGRGGAGTAPRQLAEPYRDAVDEDSIASFPASDPPPY